MEWRKNEATGHVQAVEEERLFDIESNGRRKELWYGREGRRIRVGLFDTETEAKIIAEDIAENMKAKRKILEDQYA